MSKFYLFFALVMVVIVSGCNLNIPEDSEIIDTDWCWKFDFRANANMNLVVGEYIPGLGYATDELTNMLSISYDHGSDIYPAVIEVTITRIDEGDITVTAAGNVFGIISEVGNQSYPAIAPSPYDVRFGANYADEHAPTANVSLQTNGGLALSEVRVYGNGPSPWGYSNCGDNPSTPTPFITLPPSATTTSQATDTPQATNTPTPTLSPTSTSTPTPTPSWSPSPPPPWCEVFDFTANSGAWAGWSAGIYSGQSAAEYIPGVGWHHVDLDFEDHDRRLANISLAFPVQGNVTSVAVHYSYSKGTFNPSSAFSLRGGGLNSANTFSVGGGASAPASPATWAGSSVAATSFNFSLTGSALNADKGAGFSGNATITSASFCGNGANPFQAVYPPSPTTTATASATIVPTNTQTYNPTWVTHTPSMTITPRYTVGATFTPNPSHTLPPPPTATWLPIFTWQPLPPSTTPFPGGTGTGTPEGTATGTVIATGTVTLTPGLDGIFDPDSPVSNIGGIGSGIFAFMTNFMNLSFAWLGDMNYVLTSFIDVYSDAQPQAPPGVPNCNINPTINQVCAIWYIIRFTVLGEPLGSLISRIMLIVVDIFIVFQFIHRGRAILARARTILRS